jgi:peptide/nickel transport system ATP-binding protein
MEPILKIHKLETQIQTVSGPVPVVRQVSFAIPRGGTVGLVGESGCGKSLTALSILRLVQYPVRIVGGEIWFSNISISKNVDESPVRAVSLTSKDTGITSDSWRSVDLLTISEAEMRKVRGREIAMIFQEPMTALNPVLTIGSQIIEAVQAHEDLPAQDAKIRALEALRAVSVPMTEQRLKDYPHQLSGGLRQRAMIAMALVARPSFLIADEPTTALDVTIQAQILDLLGKLKEQYRLSLLIISHDLGVVSKIADRVCIMYAGQVVEEGPARSVLQNPLHPYTEALMRAVPRRGMTRRQGGRLESIPGTVPDPRSILGGCAFQPRCKYEMGAKCSACQVELVSPSLERQVRCVKYV